MLNARKIREIADYDIDEEIVEPLVSVTFDEGREFIAAIRAMLANR